MRVCTQCNILCQFVLSSRPLVSTLSFLPTRLSVNVHVSACAVTSCLHVCMYRHFSYYIDMKALQLLVGLGHMTDDSMVIGRCTVPALDRLSEKQPLEGYKINL